MKKRTDKGYTVNVVGETFTLRHDDFEIIKTGKGWKEPADKSGKAPRHKAVATKNKLKTTARKPMEKLYYSSNDISTAFPFKDFVDIEIKERGNYQDLNIPAIKKKYNVTDNTSVIWVTPIKWIANRYNLSGDDYDNAENIPEDEMDIHEYSSNDGVIVKETDDGDDGFLFIFNNSMRSKIKDEKQQLHVRSTGHI